MRAIVHSDGEGPGSLRVEEIDDPVAGPGEVVIDVVAAGVNRADLLQTKGLYPPPDGASEILGLECSGTVSEIGEGVTNVSLGDKVCALLSGGGYAEKVAVPSGQIITAPEVITLAHAAALPEVACTVWSNIVMTGGLGQGRLSSDARSDSELLGAPRVLLHGGAGGIGSHAIAVCRELGARIAATAGTPEKQQLCRDHGADLAINYNDEDFVEQVRDWTRDDPRGPGVDLILDVIGAKYLERNISALAPDGRLIVIGLQGGVKGEVNLAEMLGKRAGMLATNLRKRPVSGVGSKSAVCSEVFRHVWPLVGHGVITPGVTSEFPLERAAEALQLLESGESHGKLLLTV